MGFFDRYRKSLPEVVVDDQLKNRIGDYCEQLPVPAEPKAIASAFRHVLKKELYAISEEYRQAAPVHPDALELQLMLCGWAGMAAQVAEEHGWRSALETTAPVSKVLREYVAFSRREEWDKGPIPLIVYAQQQNQTEMDPVHATLGVMAQLLGLTSRTGGLEGYFRLGILCWMAGEVLGEKIALVIVDEEESAEEQEASAVEGVIE